MSKRGLLVAIAAVGVVLGSAMQAAAQEGFTLGHTDAGPVIGLGGIGGADFAIGGRYEVGFKELPNLGNGILGIQGAVDYYNYKRDFSSFTSSNTYIPISVVANYHFNLKNRKLDPFFGAGLGYLYWRHSCESNFSFGCDSVDSSGGVYLVGRVGVRYFVSPKLALYADAGAGAASLDVGVVFKLK